MHPCDQANWRLKWHSQRSSALSSGGGGAGGLAAPANRASWRSTCRLSQVSPLLSATHM